MSQPYKSGRQKNLNLGISSITENDTVLQVTGKVGIGTTLAGGRSLYVLGDVETTGVTTLAKNGGITTTGGDLYVGGDLYINDDLFFDEFTSRNANVTGIATIATLVNNYAGITTAAIVTGIITTLSGTNLNYSGVGTITTLYATTANVTTANVVTGIVTTLSGTNLNYSGVGTITNIVGTSATISRIVGSAVSISQLQVTGISTFNNGPVFIGSATSTGTATQRLQVTGGAYVSGSVGVGTTNPRETLDVVGTVGIQSIGSANRFEIVHNATLNSLDFIFI